MFFCLWGVTARYERFLALHVILIVPGTAGDFLFWGPFLPPDARLQWRGWRGVRGGTGLRCASQAITISLWQSSALSCVFSSVRTTSYYYEAG